MITITKNRNDKFVARGTGRLTTAPRYQRLDSGKTVCNFFLCADTVGTGTDKVYESYSVNTWDELADYCSNLEKGDFIELQGECLKDQYYSNKNGKDEYKIIAEFVRPADISKTVFQLQLLYENMKEKIDALIKRESSDEETQEILNGFKDMPLPDEIFPDI